MIRLISIEYNLAQTNRKDRKFPMFYTYARKLHEKKAHLIKIAQIKNCKLSSKKP